MTSTPTCLICYYLVLEEVSKWNIGYLNKEQAFGKTEYGVKFVIPPSSVEEGQEVRIEVSVVSPENSDVNLPPNVKLVSCFYKIKATRKFSRPVKLCLQHNVELRSQEESQQLAFIRAEGPPPYKFELLPTEYEQVFRPYDNFGVVTIPDFCCFAIVIQTIWSFICQQPCYSYAMTVFFKEKEKFSWEIQAVVTKNLGPFIEVCNHDEKKNFNTILPLYAYSFVYIRE